MLVQWRLCHFGREAAAHPGPIGPHCSQVNDVSPLDLPAAPLSLNLTGGLLLLLLVSLTLTNFSLTLTNTTLTLIFHSDFYGPYQYSQ
jgi:hypothetical protein